jgi:hypothetical protein
MPPARSGRACANGSEKRCPYKDLPSSEGGPVDRAACQRIADYMRAEIERIVSVSEPWKP